MVQSLVVVKALPAEMSEGRIIRFQHIKVSHNLGEVKIKQDLLFTRTIFRALFITVIEH